jgi:hypothetical protein
MVALIFLFSNLVASLIKSRSRLEAENAALRQQLIVLQRKVRGRVEFTNGDRLFFIQLYRWFPSVLKVITIIRPETLVRWHRAGFRRFSNRPSGVKRFQAIHQLQCRCRSRACASLRTRHHGPSIMGIRRRGGTIYWAALPSM